MNRALQMAETNADAHYLQCRILRSLAAVYRDRGEIQKSENLLNKAIDLARSADDDRGMAAAYNAFGTLYHRANDPEKAITNLNESLAHMPLEHFDRSRVYNNLGLAYLRLRKFDESERWFKRSLELKALGGDTLGQANTQMNLVRLYREGASLAKAARAANAAAELFGRVFAWRETGDARATLAHLLAESGDRERAERSCKRPRQAPAVAAGGADGVRDVDRPLAGRRAAFLLDVAAVSIATADAQRRHSFNIAIILP
ncbi:MAG TPA: tetratricopeptide repeat protein [Thermoanaerobaculia bacterium]|nr:tetratricopeptide repeat protein [Thermoanaerobaculia bacterium]